MSRPQFSSAAEAGRPPLISEPKSDNNSSPELEAIENMSLSANTDVNMGGTAPSTGPGGLGGGAGIQQPKVQTAFIHKLYNMLEDVNIQHLISWSSTNESFVVSPTSEFSKVLSQYFKHTNVSSFVRQLNMYGFHKVNDVFHNGAPDAALWEFKHGNGNFKRGDLVGLREIKRRASRHALIHRDSFSGPKGAATSSPGTPGDQGGDSVEARLLHLEHSLYDVGSRLARSEEHNSILSHRCQTLVEGLTRCHQWTIDLSQFVTHLCPRDAPIIREIQSMQKEIERHTRLMEEPQDMHMRDRPIFTSTVESAPLSPRQRPIDEEQRPQFLSATRPGGLFRPPPPPHMSSLPARRFGSFSGGPPSPTSHRPQPPPPQPQQPLPGFHSPPSHLSRRHTSADIRLHGWRPENSPFHPSNSSGSHQWPPSPRGSISHDNPRETLAAYEINKRPTSGYGHTTPPPSVGGGISENGWTFANAKYPSRSNAPDPGPSAPPAPPTRRSSMVSSSVHALLNPSSETNGDRDDCDPMEDRKRKRLA